MSCEPMDDSKWRAESDARTLMEAMKIKGDKERFSRAMQVAREEAEARNKLLRGHKGSAADMVKDGFTKL